MNKFFKILFLLSFAFLVAGCTHEVSTEGNGSAGSTVEDSNVEGTSSETADFVIDSFNFGYDPSVLEIEAGKPVTLEIKGSGHDFVIDEFNVNSGMIFGSKKVTFTIPESFKGKEVEFYCSIGNHRQSGMVGKIKVL